MNMRFKIALLALLAFVPLAMPTAVLADAGQKVEAGATFAALKAQAPQACAASLEKKLNIAQTSQAECCKDHKGVCGCRAGKIICCDSTASTKPDCTCHGDDGFLE
jgi:hypothetical protein